MKTAIYIILFYISMEFAFSQKQVLGDYDFLSNNYKLFICQRSYGADSSFSSCSLLINKSKLDSLKKIWVGENSETTSNCLNDYSIYLIYKDSIIDDFEVNTECGQVIMKKQIVKFSGNPIGNILVDSKVYQRRFTFTSLGAARKRIYELEKNKSYYFPFEQNYDWILYDGYFVVTKKFNYLNKKRTIRKAEKMIKTVDPIENIHIEFGGFGYNYFNLVIHCNYKFYKECKATFKSEWNSFENNRDLIIDVLSDKQKLMTE